ncbi:phage tail protein [Grimontia hollisae]|uniref:phage tail protein n=1 Tax=Grimontia hollisae TaxID=673 RepID=UPI00130345A1|nr:phage tail protein [Grimontia hollisae]
MKLPDINFKYWMGREGSELVKFARALRRYWRKVDAALRLPLTQFDALTAPLGIVKLMAWERDISPLEREDERIFRIRVANAYTFARHAGETRGFKNMFARLGIDWMDIHEREDPVQWDVVTIETADGDLAQKNWLMNAMIRQYGRTCRRYRFNVTYPATLHMHCAAFGHRFALAKASACNDTRVAVRQQRIEHNQQMFIASMTRKP